MAAAVLGNARGSCRDDADPFYRLPEGLRAAFTLDPTQHLPACKAVSATRATGLAVSKSLRRLTGGYIPRLFSVHALYL